MTTTRPSLALSSTHARVSARLPSVSRRPTRHRVALAARAEVLWSLAPSEESKKRAIPFRSYTYPVEITQLIDAKRPGPNKTGSIIIGADPQGVELVLDIDTVSGKHASLEEDGDTGDLYVQDLDSTNGTYLNGERIKERTKVNPGDKLSFGAEPVFVCQRNTFAHA